MKEFLKNIQHYKHIHIVIIGLALFISLILHFPIFNYDFIGYHVWRQTQTQTVIENFCHQDFTILNPRLNNLVYPDGIIRMEFPLYQWIIACFCKLFGHHIVVTRIVTFIIGAFSLLGFYLLANSILKNKILAAIGAWAIGFSPIFYYYTINPLPDNLALCFGIYALYFFSAYHSELKIKQLIFFSFFISLATLCKLPFILFAIPFAVYWIKSKAKVKELTIIMIFLLPSIIWYASVIGSWEGNGIVKGIFANTITLIKYLDYLQGNLISIIPELYINYAALFLFIAGVFYLFKNKIINKSGIANCFFFGLVGVAAYFLYELNMITTIHDYYLFPFLPFLFLISLYGFKILTEQKKKYLRLLAFACILLMPITAYLRSQTRWNLIDPGFDPALLNYKKQIQALIPENAICLTGNDDSQMVNLYYLNRKGYTFYEDQLNKDILNKYKEKGVTYLISDAKLNEETINILPAPLAVYNDLKIYKLK